MALLIPFEKRPEDVLFSLEKGSSAVFRYDFAQWYLPDNPILELLVVALADDLDRSLVRLLIVRAYPEIGEILSGKSISRDALSELALTWEVPLIDLSQTLKLEPVAISKPWGQEIWYTGMEKRGLSLVTDGHYSMPLAWLIGVLPTYLMGAAEVRRASERGASLAPNLLKILDPLSEPIFGDLYFELHEEKREVYVVTHVDERAWPDGVGGIRYGFAAQARAAYSNDAEFRSAYLAAVLAYRLIRKQIDELVDVMRLEANIGLDEPVSADQAKQWLQGIPTDLGKKEASLREAMNNFTAVKALRLGDVVKVPLLMPHALQHGVRTVEFQTPVYERKILSFAQKVLTQENWDTAEAVELMSLAPQEKASLKLLEDGSAVKREQIVDFEDFEVQRITLKTIDTWVFPDTDSYLLVMTIQGVLEIDGQVLRHEEAAFVPANCAGITLQSLSEHPCIVLISQPKSQKQ